MIIYVSMILWIPFIYFFYSLSHKEEIKLADYNLSQGKIEKIPVGYCILIFGFFVFWIGFRSFIADTTADIAYFNNIPVDFTKAWGNINWNGKSPVYDVINILFKCFVSQDYQMWLMTVAIICGLCMLIGIRRFSCNFFYSAYLFMTLLIFYWMINGMRQFICVAILFAFSQWIERGCYFRIFVLVLLLSSIHLTALIFLPVYFVIRREPWRITTLVLIVVVAGITIFSDTFFKGIETTFGGVAYKGYTDQFYVDDGVNFLRFLFSAIFPAMALWKHNELKKYYSVCPILPICINASVITALIFFIGMFTSGILVGRLPIYTEVYNMVLIPFLIKFGFDERERRIFLPLLTILLFVYFWIKIPHTYNSTVLNVHIYNAFM